MTDGKAKDEMAFALQSRTGRKNVKREIIDMRDSYRSFIESFYPYAEVIADKFFLLRLITPPLNRRIKEITGDKRNNPIRRLLLRKFLRLKFYEKKALQKWLDYFPELREVYSWKEKLHAFYRIHSFLTAQKAFNHLTEKLFA